MFYPCSIILGTFRSMRRCFSLRACHPYTFISGTLQPPKMEQVYSDERLAFMVERGEGPLLDLMCCIHISIVDAWSVELTLT